MITLKLSPNETFTVNLSVDFNESPSLGIELIFNRTVSVKLVAPFGEILNPVRFESVQCFNQQRSKLTGMNEIESRITLKKSYSISELIPKLKETILTLGNFCSNQHLSESDSKDVVTLYFSGSTLKTLSLLLITIVLETSDDGSVGQLHTVVNSDKLVFGSIMSKQIKDECNNSF